MILILTIDIHYNYDHNYDKYDNYVKIMLCH